jgi:uncharacterized protein YcbX
MPTLDRITIYPVKSLDGVTVDEAVLQPAGGIEHDRRWRLIDTEGRVINAKQEPLLLAIRAQVDVVAPAIRLAADPQALAAAVLPGIERLEALAAETFSLAPGPTGPCGWLEAALGRPVLIMERREGGFPDDRDAPGPTVVATATLREVARWFELDVDECRRRFRANLEIGDCEAFWEDAVASPMPVDGWAGDAARRLDDPAADVPPPEPGGLWIGETALVAARVCRRCQVPTRDSRTGAVLPHFRDAFEARRRHGLRPDVDAADWGDTYRLAINTVVTVPGVVGVAAEVQPMARPGERR